MGDNTHIAVAMDGTHSGLVDQTIDASIVHMRSEKDAEDRKRQGTTHGDTAQSSTNVPQTEGISDRAKPFVNTEILYNSFQRSIWWHALAWLWCGCFEPKYKVTSSYVIGEEWQGCCLRVTDSMAYENVNDVQRRQNCCYFLMSYVIMLARCLRSVQCVREFVCVCGVCVCVCTASAAVVVTTWGTCG